MLPEALSNEVCSLKPNVDRLTKCVEFVISKEGRVLQGEISFGGYPSHRRFTYRERLIILRDLPPTPLRKCCITLMNWPNGFASALCGRFVESWTFRNEKFDWIENGRIRRIEKVENDISHQLIEEFMLLANEAVAAFLMREHRPAIYRIHEPPDPERLREYREELAAHQIPAGDLTQRKEVQKLLRTLDTLPIGGALKIGFLKSLMRARYAVEPLGHYGLAKAESPILLRPFGDMPIWSFTARISTWPRELG